MANPEDISGTSKIDPTKAIKGTESEQQQPKAGQFSSYMEGQGPQGTKVEGPSPFDLAQSAQTTTAGASMQTLQGQMTSTSSVLGDLNNQLNTKNLKLKQSQKYLLRNKLTSANQNIRTAADKVGVDTGPPPSTTTKQSPVAKFLALVTDGQNQLQQSKEMIQKLNTNGQHLDPGELLLIQVKISKAQQELEYSSVLLSKAVDDIKTMFNIQI